MTSENQGGRKPSRRKSKLMNTPLNQPLTVSAAAAIAGRAERTIRKWCANGTLKAAKFGSDWLILKQDLDKLMQSPPRRGPKVKVK